MTLNGNVWGSQDISKRDAQWGLTTDTLDEAHADAQARKPDGFTYIDHGTLHRIAASLESIERMLGVVTSDKIAEMNVKRSADHREIRAQFNDWLSGLEDRHGPCPRAVRLAWMKTFGRWLRVHFPWAISLRTRSYQTGPRPPFPDVIFVPPCGPKSKTRKEYNAWKRRRRKEPPA